MEVPPPGAGVNTVIGNDPTEVMSSAEIVAFNSEALIRVVGLSKPLNRTTEVGKKLVPVIVKVKVATPTGFVSGEIPVIVGAAGWKLPTTLMTELPVPVLNPLAGDPEVKL
ncbi:hypothetical protein [Pontibacter litorisediminis]|uniref:hypothetical protein n=1 Tax=Pontibacter litorisediminis TaxID=1846260 RepID=UPI0023EDEBC8|nr:hypothetical protein [Pontibacter litorisediminis]